MHELGICEVLRLETEREYKQMSKIPRNRDSYAVGSGESARATWKARKRPIGVARRYGRSRAESGERTRHVTVVVSSCVIQYSRAVWIEE